jgi:hypothetical protein
LDGPKPNARIRSTNEITAMLTAAGFMDIEHERGDDADHTIRRSVARPAGIIRRPRATMEG